MKIYSTDPDLQRAFLLGYAWAVGVMYGRRNRIAQDDQKWRTTDNGKHYQVDTDTKRVIKGNIGFSNVGGQKASESVTANIQRGKEAVRKALQDKTSVHRAMYREGLGWVDFVWGSEGHITSHGNTRGGMGISHIISERKRKDGLSDKDIPSFLENMVNVIAQGKEIRRRTFSSSTNVVIAHKNYEAVLVKNKGANGWIISGWEVK